MSVKGLHFSTWKRASLLTLVSLWLAGCQSGGGSLSDLKQIKQLAPPPQVSEYKIGIGDQINISVWRNADLSLSVPVRPDGYISVPLVGDIMATGLTPAQLDNLVTKKLQDYIKSPQVTIILTGLNSHNYVSRIRITGAVNSQTSILYREGMTILDVMLDVGGVNQFASANKTRLYRKIDGKTKIFNIRLQDILEKGDLTTNVHLWPGDIITVPEKIL